MASPRYEETTETPTLDVHRLESSADVDSESVVMVKLTDEIVAALQVAQRSKGKLRITIDEKGGVLELGEAGRFHFQTQTLKGDTDTLRIDGRSGAHCAVGAFHHKYQIQATDKSFAETREKAQKLIEDEKSRGVKDATKHRKGVVGSSRVGSASSSRHSSPLLAKGANDSRISPNKFNNSTGTNGLASSANNGSVRQVNPLAGELRKKKLRQRVIQLVVTGKYNNSDEIVRQLRKDGLNDEQDSTRRIDDTIRDVTDKTEQGKLALKSALYPEVDSRWPWFSQEEKAAVRRLTMPSQQHFSSSSFAPTRKSGIDRMQAPAQSQSQTVSPEAIPTPPNSRPSSGGSGSTSVAKKPSQPLVLAASSRDSPVATPVHDAIVEESATSISASKRKAHVPSQLSQVQGAAPEKRPRQESASPPEDPTNHHASNGHHHMQAQKDKFVVARAGGSTSSSRLSSPCSLSSPSQPSCDWEKLYPEIKNVNDAEKYFSLFHGDYPTYMECYKQLNKVASEFRNLEHQLKKCGRHENARIERNIQERFAHFEKDDDFLKSRQTHADLRKKLSVLKSRIAEWDRSQDTQTSLMSL